VVLPADIADFIQGGVSITVASRDERLVPSIAKGVGCRVAAASDQVTVMIFANAAQAVARDITRHAQVAVVFSKPSTNRTVQLKGRDVAIVPTTPADLALVRRWMALFADDLQLLGWDLRYVEATFLHDPSQLMALRFTPEGAFQQTPGPAAGAPLAMQAASR
jgi:hypothetical protein